ncbi:hypothetical protein [uncultured Arthrobacter sp.]|uniref:hypothetical protein n=1 Tax=uncultured Arthrobacter sp. TaxID=114050 RepID=UPI0025F5EB5A|nr:hypothetical protein [uncultured Arthrobacter sp.]
MPYDVDAGPSVPRRGRRPAFNPAGPSGPARWRAVAGALLGGMLAALLGTALHAQVLRVGELALPVGAAAALVLAGSIITWCGLWARSILIAALSGGTAYLLVALVSLSAETLILTGIEGPGPEPAAVLAGNIWMFGLAAATIAGIAVCGASLRGHRSGGSAPTGS